jgi:hypothetical protein
MSWPLRWSFAGGPVAADPEPPAQLLPSLADEFLESYVGWREACEDVNSAYERWDNCEPPQRAVAFKVYRAALDWEEHTADVHSDRAERLRASVR